MAHSLSAMWGYDEKSAVCNPEDLGFQQNSTMLALWSQTSSLQNHETYIAIIYKPPVYTWTDKDRDVLVCRHSDTSPCRFLPPRPIGDCCEQSFPTPWKWPAESTAWTGNKRVCEALILGDCELLHSLSHPKWYQPYFDKGHILSWVIV